MTSTACDDQFAPDASSREAAIDAMVQVVQPHEWRQGGAMRYAGHTITWGEYVQRRHEMEEEFTVEPALDRDEMLQLLALRLRKWPQDCDDCERTEPAGWGWQWHDVPPDCEFVLAVPGREGREWCITESDWRKACWDAGEDRMDAIGANGPTGDHYPPTCADGLPCGVAHSPGDDAYCLRCPHEPKGEGGDGASALSQAMSMPSKYHVRLKGAWCDVYDVLKAFGVTNPADQHAIKKMLMPGKRGHKGGIQDRREAIQSLQRAIELEDGQ